MPRISKFEYSTSDSHLLGKGAFSQVYLGKYKGRSTRRIKRGSNVAIKVIDTKSLTPRAIRILDDEITIMELIRDKPHPNIVICHEIIRDDNNKKVYIVMEYCDSGDLRNILVGRPIREFYVQFYFSQLANGLRYLDKNRIIHRDIKPRNILLTNDKRVLKIADFGFARKMADNSLYDTICGSPLYMAPEIMTRNSYNNQTDLWSIGMILYEMLFGSHPFQNCKDIPQLRGELENRSIPIPPDNNPNTNISASCLALLRDLLQKDVKKRITWEKFFMNSWINKYKDNGKPIEKKNEGYEEYQDKLRSVSLGSLNKETNLPKKLTEIDGDSSVTVIDNYLDRSNNSLRKTTDVDDINGDSDCMFEIEIEDDTHQFVVIKSVVDKSSVLPDDGRYEVVERSA